MEDVEAGAGYPIYVKKLTPSEILLFKTMIPEDVTSFVLWETPGLSGPNARLISDQGISVAITPALPLFDFSFFGPRIPFAIRQNTALPQSCQALSKPNGRQSNVSDTVPLDATTLFPLCLQNDTQWKLAHFTVLDEHKSFVLS